MRIYLFTDLRITRLIRLRQGLNRNYVIDLPLPEYERLRNYH